MYVKNVEKNFGVIIIMGLINPPDFWCWYHLVADNNEKLPNAIVAQLVERDLAKVEVVGSNPIYRSISRV